MTGRKKNLIHRILTRMQFFKRGEKGMNSKTIKKVLKQKHEEFLRSITDSPVKELVKKNSIITGGAIASMLLNEKISDFDYYFRDKETVEAVADYYVNRFNEDQEKKDKYSPEVRVDGDRVKIFIKSAGEAGEAPEEFDAEQIQEALDTASQTARCIFQQTLLHSLTASSWLSAFTETRWKCIKIMTLSIARITGQPGIINWHSRPELLKVCCLKTCST